jgi:hypothetical protein
MKKVLQVSLLFLVLGLAGCILVSDDHDDPGYDFNGIWRFALTGCQSQFADAEIFQSGTDFTMVSNYRFDGICDPYTGDFHARADEPWGYWEFWGRATGSDTLAGTYAYGEYRVGECTGSFSATRIGYRAAGALPGQGLSRQR